MSRVSLIAQHFVRLRRRSAVFSQAVKFDAIQWQLETPPQDAVEASLDNPLDNPLEMYMYVCKLMCYM